MIHPNCLHRGTHNWDNWRWAPSMPDGTLCKVDHDTYEAEGKHFTYRRECQNTGCDAVELAHKLMADGEHVVLDLGGSEVLYSEK